MERMGRATRLRRGYGVPSIEHVRSGLARVDGNAARELARAWGHASDQGKVAREAISEFQSSY